MVSEWSRRVVRTVERKTNSGKANFIAQVVETADAVLGVFVVVVLDKAKAMDTDVSMDEWMERHCQTYPLQRPVE